VVSQYDKDDVEAVGLVKFDFLGLTTLTILDRAVRYIKRSIRPSRLRPGQAAAGRPAVLRAADQGQNRRRVPAGIARHAGHAERCASRPLRRHYRAGGAVPSGPDGPDPDFCKRKHGEKFDYPDPRTESILSETYGIMVYQEQVMQMAQIVGGYSLGGADMLRRAMGKKKPRRWPSTAPSSAPVRPRTACRKKRPTRSST
jgi:DNA polymerase-3 subunit alpha